MDDQIYTDVDRRHDFVLLFDVTDGNPNGDPDAGNLPRVDPETMQGLVTDVCLKRKVRDWVDAMHGQEGHYKIYVQSGIALNAQHKRGYEGSNQPLTDKPLPEVVDKVRDWMCHNFYDIRMFGAVMATKVNAGLVRGPLQLTFARSINEIVPLEVSITRIAVTREEDLRVVASEEEGGATKGKQTEMGRKSIVPYGLYRAHGFFNPHFAKRTGVADADLELFWQALQNMWDFDHSAARGMMSCRGLYVFSHESSLGNAPAHKLFDLITIEPRMYGLAAPRSFSDYEVIVDEAGLPEGVTLTRLSC